MIFETALVFGEAGVGRACVRKKHLINDACRKRSQSVGPGSKVMDRMTSSSSKSTSSTNLANEASKAEDENGNTNADIADGASVVSTVSITAPSVVTAKPSHTELRMAQYEKPLAKGHKTKSRTEKRDPEKVARKRSEKRQRSAVLRDKIVKLIEGGQQLSEYQARKAFSVYLQCLLHRLSDFDPDNPGAGDRQGGSDPGQLELILKFVQKAALSLREPYFLKAPSVKLSGKDRAAVIAKELSEFLGHYRRETEAFTVFREEQGMVPRHTFEEFIAFAHDVDLEAVLTVQTRLYRCAHIFLGKCLPPPASSLSSASSKGGRHSLLKAAYALSPDRNLRDKQCAMRVNARANPPVAAKFQLPPSKSAKCVDITTYERSKLEELLDVEEGGGGEIVQHRQGHQHTEASVPRVSSAPSMAS